MIFLIRTSFVLAFLFIFIPSSLFAQTTEGDELEILRQLNQGDSGLGIGTIVGFDKRYEATQGSVFLFEDWHVGSVKSSLGKTYKNVYLKFDAYANQLYMKGENEKSPLLLNKTDVAEFTIDRKIGLSTSTFKLINEGEGVYTFVEVLLESKISAYKKIGKYLKKASTSVDSYGGGNNFDKFISTESILVVQDGENIEFNRSKSGILNAFPKYKKIMRKYYKKEKIDIDKDSDVIKILSFYESLI